jgi:hypothetical protein
MPLPSRRWTPRSTKGCSSILQDRPTFRVSPRTRPSWWYRKRLPSAHDSPFRSHQCTSNVHVSNEQKSFDLSSTNVLSCTSDTNSTVPPLLSPNIFFSLMQPTYFNMINPDYVFRMDHSTRSSFTIMIQPLLAIKGPLECTLHYIPRSIGPASLPLYRDLWYVPTKSNYPIKSPRVLYNHFKFPPTDGPRCPWISPLNFTEPRPVTIPLLFFVDLYSKIVHFAPTTTDVSAPAVAKIFFNTVFRLHKLPIYYRLKPRHAIHEPVL